MDTWKGSPSAVKLRIGADSGGLQQSVVLRQKEARSRRLLFVNLRMPSVEQLFLCGVADELRMGRVHADGGAAGGAT